MNRTRVCAWTCAALLAAAGCDRGDGEPAAVREAARPETRIVGGAGSGALGPMMLGTVDAVPVSGWKGPGGASFEVTRRTADPADAHARRFGGLTRRVALRARSPALGQYPCTSCHLGRAVVMSDDRRVEDAHADIAPRHPELTGATCASCHAADDVERLALRSGERATLDHVYRLCAQCHFAQVEAWAGGGHGKRLDGWRGRRVVLGCADCHDPHDPAVERRIPYRAPTIARAPRAEP
jgi:hypothetical protein